MVLIFYDTMFRRSDGKASFEYIIQFNGSIVYTRGVRGEAFVPLKEGG